MNPYRHGLALAAALALGACHTTPPVNNELVAARQALTQAQAEPGARAASVEFERAQQALQRAELAWAKNRDDDETGQLTYLARRRTDIAMAVAAQAAADERLQQAGAERERARLDARTREAEMAAQAARVAQASARNAQSQAHAAQSQADAAQRQAQQERDRVAALEHDLQSLRARPTERGLVVTLGDVLFASGRADLQPGAQRSVQTLAQVLQQYPERRVLVEGFTDSQGSEQANLELSQRRAEAFRHALLQTGVSDDRIEVRAHGEAFPVADNGSAAGRQQNRRVEVLFSGPEGRFPAAR